MFWYIGIGRFGYSFNAVYHFNMITHQKIFIFMAFSFRVMSAKYLSSTQSLEELCRTNPDHPIKSGIGKTLKGFGLTGVVVGLGYGLWYFGHEIKDIISYGPEIGYKVGAGVLSGIGLLVSVVDLALGYQGLKFSAEGITSLLKPLSSHSDDGSVYLHNGGFTNKPSFSDIKFGTKVVPVESVNDLMEHADKGYSIHINGFEKEKVVEVLSSSSGYTNEVILEGVLNEKQLTLSVNVDRNFTRKLITDTSGSAYFFEGPLSKNNGLFLIDVKYRNKAHKTLS